MTNESDILKELMKHSTQRISITYTLFLIILEEKVTDGRGHSINTDSFIVDQGSRQYRLFAFEVRRDSEKS